MCNPPFYDSQEDIDSRRLAKTAEPNGTCTGTDREMITVGGEEGFLSRMIEESFVYRSRVSWSYFL